MLSATKVLSKKVLFCRTKVLFWDEGTTKVPTKVLNLPGTKVLGTLLRRGCPQYLRRCAWLAR